MFTFNIPSPRIHHFLLGYDIADSDNPNYRIIGVPIRTCGAIEGSATRVSNIVNCQECLKIMASWPKNKKWCVLCKAAIALDAPQCCENCCTKVD